MQEVELQEKLKACSLVEDQQRQIRERELLKEKQLQQEKKDREMLLGIAKQYAQEQIHQEKKQSKRRNLQYLLENISRQKLKRG